MKIIPFLCSWIRLLFKLGDEILANIHTKVLWQNQYEFEDLNQCDFQLWLVYFF